MLFRSDVASGSESLIATGTTPIVGYTVVQKTGGGKLVISGSNQYYGGTTVGDGVLVAGNASAFGAGSIMVNGGMLDLASFAVANSVRIKAGAIANAENLSGSVEIAGAVSVTGTIGGRTSVSNSGELRGNNAVFSEIGRAHV